MPLTAFGSRVRCQSAAARAPRLGSLLAAVVFSASHLGCGGQTAPVDDASLADTTKEDASSAEASVDATVRDAANPSDATAGDAAPMRDGAGAPDSTPDAGDAWCTPDVDGAPPVAAPGTCCNSQDDCQKLEPYISCCTVITHRCGYCGPK
jgi:hypothetical protein